MVIVDKDQITFFKVDEVNNNSSLSSKSGIFKSYKQSENLHFG